VANVCLVNSGISSFGFFGGQFTNQRLRWLFLNNEATHPAHKKAYWMIVTYLLPDMEKSNGYALAVYEV